MIIKKNEFNKIIKLLKFTWGYVDCDTFVCENKREEILEILNKYDNILKEIT